MANNRMWLVNDRLKLCALIAKYYPSAGWYLVAGDNFDKAFDLDEFRSQDGPTDWRVIYDSDLEHSIRRDYRIVTADKVFPLDPDA